MKSLLGRERHVHMECNVMSITPDTETKTQDKNHNAKSPSKAKIVKEM